MTRNKVILLTLVSAILVVVASSIYVLVAAGPDLFRARAALTGDVADLGDEDLENALANLSSARQGLRSVPARMLSLVPIARQNLAAVEALTERTIPTVEAARHLHQALSVIRDDGLIEDGVVRLEEFDELGRSVGRQAQALRALETSLGEHRNGWLLPPVWDAMDGVLRRTTELRESAERAQWALELAPPMLGREGGRTYLVLLLNNAELRGAGGIASAIGTLTVDDGALSLGEFDYYADLSRAVPDRRVPSPPDFERRFSRYEADTTLWVNVGASPDGHDVALVAARLYRVSTGIDTDGVIILDPRALQALTPPGTTLDTEEGESVAGEELARFVYHEAYQHDPEERRDALLDLGPQVLDAVIEAGMNLDGLEEVANTAAGRHIRVVSFDEDEQAVLTELDASGDLAPRAEDSVLVTVQNQGADKLDFWMRRSIAHSCRIEPGEGATCTTEVSLSNQARRGLHPYVVQDKRPYAVYEGYLEVYVPQKADVSGFSMDGEAPEVFVEPHGSYVSLGTGFSTRREQTTRVVVEFELPLDADKYSLEVVPQPLSHDAEATITVDVPSSWVIAGTDSAEVGEPHRDVLDRPLRLRAAPSDRTGLSALWAWLGRFWREPLFSG